MTIKLSSETLGSLPPDVAVPRYDRSALKSGIVHFGVGNFHRSHQAVYLDDLFNAGDDHDWAIVGAGVFDGEKAGRGKLEEQDWLTTVVEQDSGHMSARVTGVMIDFLVPGDAAAIIERLADPATRIVSLTITEGGYFIDPASGVFNPTHPDIVADAGDIAAPKTVFGLILAGLMRRRADGIVPFTVMSCDNIPHNGHVTSDGVVGLARLVDADLADWVGEQRRLSERHGRPHHAGDLRPRARHSGKTSSASRTTGRYSASLSGNGCWRINFTAGRPALEKVGVQFVRDVVALRTDEDPHPQRRPRDDRLSGRADGHPFRARGDAGAAGARLPRQARARRDHRRPCRRCPASCSKTITSSSSSASPIRRSAIPCAGFASTAPTGSRNSSSRPSPTG